MPIDHIHVTADDISGLGPLDAPMRAVVDAVLSLVNDGVNPVITVLNDAEQAAESVYGTIRKDAVTLWSYVRYIERLMVIVANGVWTYLANVVYQLLGPNSVLMLAFEDCIAVVAVVVVWMVMSAVGGWWAIVSLIV